VLDLLLEPVDGVAALAEQPQHRNATRRCRGPQQHLRGAVLADHHRLDIARPDPQPIGQLHPEAQAVDQGPGREHPVVAGEAAGEVGQRVGGSVTTISTAWGATATTLGTMSAYTVALVSSSRSRPAS
jgi:hypothetical protein